MKSKLLIITVFILFVQSVFSQEKNIVIKATSKFVDIKDGDILKKGSWTIVPEAKPDVYLTSSKKVAFYTDIDSISFDVDPSVDAYNFCIILNDKDTAYTQIKYQIPYLDKLKIAKKYNYSDNRFFPLFSYQSKENENLIKLRNNFKLDSIAGQGNEISKIINLMHWVHNIIKHDGSSRNPSSVNAIDLIKVCKSENRGVNCRMMAIILNECYLSLGFKSRYVTCMPKETDFNDCHVINSVFCNELNKWIWIDPTFDAYIMNENGDLLGIQEVRERLIEGKKIILNPDANWNRIKSQTKEFYLETYMAKNLYRLQCPIISAFGYENSSKGKEITFVELLPLDGIVQEPQHSEFTNDNDVKYTFYKTNNPDSFWTDKF